MALLRGVPASRVQEHGLVREPPVAVAGATDPPNGLGTEAGRQGKAQTGLEQCRCLTGSGGADEYVPGQIVQVLLRPKGLDPCPQRCLLAAGTLPEERHRFLEALAELPHFTRGRIGCHGRRGPCIHRGQHLLYETVDQRRVGVFGFGVSPTYPPNGGQHENRDLNPTYCVRLEGVHIVDGDGGESPPYDQGEDHDRDDAQHPSIENQPHDSPHGLRAGAATAASGAPSAGTWSTISTRRLRASPLGVSFGTMVSVSATPSAARRPGSTRVARSLATDSARALESSHVAEKRRVRIGTLSV